MKMLFQLDRFCAAAIGALLLSGCTVGAADDNSIASDDDPGPTSAAESAMGAKCRGVWIWRKCRLQPDWERVWTSADSTTRPYVMRTHTDGSVYVGGGAFQLRYDAVGKLIYQKHLSFDDIGWMPFGLAVDGAGNAYSAGVLALIKLSPSGETLWTARHPQREDGGYDRFMDVAIGGNIVYATGDFTEAYSTDGSLLWRKTIVGKDGQARAGHKAKLGPGGKVLVLAGDTLVQFSKTGAVEWQTEEAGFTGMDLVRSKAGAIFIAGNAEMNKHIVARLTPLGEKVWVDEFHESDTMLEEEQRIALDSNGNVIVAALATTGQWPGDRLVVLKYDADGQRLWSRSERGFMSLNSDLLKGPELLVTPANRIYVTANQTTLVYNEGGTQIGTFDDGSAADNRMTSTSSGEVFLSTVRNDGLHVWKLGVF